jgi:thiosulfate/3-mercaptopyruvate sulfurtransferase
MPVTPISQRDYANPQLLVDTEWLAAHLDDEDLRLIDVRSAQLYEASHVPGAISLAAHGSIPRAENGDMGTPEAFTQLAQSMGIDARSHVVVYDAPGAQMGATAWAFLYYGHTNVSVLDGGFQKWSSEGRPTTLTPGNYPQGHFEAETVEGLFCSLDHAKQVHGSAGTIFWDVRSEGEYAGTEARGNARPGHITGAIHLEWTELLDPESQTFKTGPELRALLDSRGITPESEIDCY